MKISFNNFTNTLFTLLIILSISTATQANTENCTSLYQVTATQLNIRDQSSTSGRVVGTLYQGDKVCIAQRSGNWGQIDSGWISTKHLMLIDTTKQNYAQSDNTDNSKSSDDNNIVFILGFIIVLSFIFFGLKTLFYHTLITLGMAEPDGRAKNGIRLTRLGKFMASISGLIIFFIFMLIGSMSK